MANVLVIYYSAYGHIEAMAQAVAEGVRDAGAKVDIKRVPELVPEQVAKASHYKLDQAATIAKIDRSDEHTSELQSIMRNSSAAFCLTKPTHEILQYNSYNI